jgi:hypothetical protein
MYQISNDGQARSLDRLTVCGRKTKGKILKLTDNGTGYLYARYSREGKSERQYIHRLVLEVFVGACPEGYQVNHIDGDKTNNHLDNLEYCTPSENQTHSYNTLKRVKVSGELNGKSRFTETIVLDMRARLEAGETQQAVAALYATDRGTVSKIHKRRLWKHI